MGLDMYLYARKYGSGYSSTQNDKTPAEMRNLVKAAGLHISDTKFSSQTGANILVPIGYWRKANAIHGWFVKNLGEGVDDCKEIFVEREDLEALLKVATEVMTNHDKAEELLPTGRGFFFGSTSYDDYYFEDIKYTIEMLTHILKSPRLKKNVEFIYRASW